MDSSAYPSAGSILFVAHSLSGQCSAHLYAYKSKCFCSQQRLCNVARDDSEEHCEYKHPAKSFHSGHPSLLIFREGWIALPHKLLESHALVPTTQVVQRKLHQGVLSIGYVVLVDTSAPVVVR